MQLVFHVCWLTFVMVSNLLLCYLMPMGHLVLSLLNIPKWREKWFFWVTWPVILSFIELWCKIVSPDSYYLTFNWTKFSLCCYVIPCIEGSHRDLPSLQLVRLASVKVYYVVLVYLVVNWSISVATYTMHSYFGYLHKIEHDAIINWYFVSWMHILPIKFLFSFMENYMLDGKSIILDEAVHNSGFCSKRPVQFFWINQNGFLCLLGSLFFLWA